MEKNLFDNTLRFDIKTSSINMKTTCYESLKIPDYKSNVYKMLSTSQSADISSVKVKDGKILIEGAVNITALYETEEADLESIQIPASFSINTDFDYPEGIYNHMYYVLVENVDLKLLKNRKIEAECILNLMGMSIITVESTTLDTASTSQNMMYKYEDIEHMSARTQSEEKTVRDSIFTNTEAEIEIVSLSCMLTDISHSLSNVGILYNAALKGSVLCSIESEKLYKSYEFEIPFNCFIERNSLAAIDYYQIYASILSKTADIDSANQDGYINVEITVKATAYMYQNSKTRALADAYIKAEQSTVEFEKQNTFLIKNKTIKSIPLCKETLLQNATKALLHSDIAVTAEPYLADGNMKYCGYATVTAVFSSYSEEEKYFVSKEKLEFDINLDIQSQSFYVYPQVTQADVKYSSGSISTDLNIEVLVFEFEENTMNIVKNITANAQVAQKEDRYIITIHYLQPDEELWDIAKKYLTSPEQILTDNNIENEDELKCYTPLIIT